MRRGMEKREEWVLETDGTALLDIMGRPGVDFTRTVSNSIMEIASVLGIEAARVALGNELRAALDFTHLNAHHLSIVMEVMTWPVELVLLVPAVGWVLAVQTGRPARPLASRRRAPLRLRLPPRLLRPASSLPRPAARPAWWVVCHLA